MTGLLSFVWTILRACKLGKSEFIAHSVAILEGQHHGFIFSEATDVSLVKNFLLSTTGCLLSERFIKTEPARILFGSISSEYLY